MSQDTPPSYCCPEQSGEKSFVNNGAVIELEVSATGLRIRPARGSETVSSEDLTDLLIREGFDPNQVGAQFSMNHHSTSTSPIAFTESGVTITGNNPREIILQKSDDLIEWQEFARITLPENLKLHVTDATGAPARFYRLSPSPY